LLNGRRRIITLELAKLEKVARNALVEGFLVEVVQKITGYTILRNNKNGISYKILPIGKKVKSPFEDISYITADITTKEIVELIKENRAGI